jgi:hypothetical protein
MTIDTDQILMIEMVSIRSIPIIHVFWELSLNVQSEHISHILICENRFHHTCSGGIRGASLVEVNNILVNCMIIDVLQSLKSMNSRVDHS